MTTQIDRRFDFSGGIKNATTWQLRKPNEVEDAINGRFNDIIGAITRRLGYTTKGSALQANKRGLGLHEAKWATGAKTLAAINNSGDTETKIKIFDSGAGTWSDLSLPAAVDPNTRIQMCDSLGETYVAGRSTSTNNRMDLLNITSTPPTPTVAVSNTRSLINAPNAKFIAEYGGSLYAINTDLGADRAYKSSPALGIVTFTQGVQEDIAAPVDLIDNVPTMTSNSAPIGTAAASSEFSASFAAWHGFDDSLDINAKWVTSNGTTTGWLRYDFGASNAKTITYYSLVGVPSNEPAESDRAPKNWTFEGSQDASSWTTLDTKTNEQNWTAGEKRVYSISNTTAYRYYRLNCSANNGDAGVLVITEMELLTSSQGTKDLMLAVDSVRYIKPGMTFDVYKSSTNTKRFSVTIASVDKNANTFTFTPYTLAFATGDVNTSTEVITLSSTTNFPTGTAIKFSSTGAVPTGLTADTLYYAINTSSTTIKVATSYVNALLGVAINLTGTGSGTMYVRLSYTTTDNDEIWLTGRHGELYYMWNTDYPSEQTADYLRIPPGFDSDSEITGWAKGNNRLFLFTKNSAHKWDQANLVTVYEDIGCIAHETIQNIGDWLFWLDSEGKVRARNDATGQEELISKPIQNLLSLVPAANLPNAAAGRINNVYKLCLGTVSGSVLRLCYDFDANTWAHETHALAMTNHMRSDMTGTKRLYFLSDAGQMYTDEDGNTDNGVTIPFVVKIGRSNQTVEQLKNYHGVYVYSVNIAGATVKASLDGASDFKAVGQLKREVEKIPFSGIGGQFSGRDINMEISVNSDGEPPRIDGLAYYFNQEEDKFGQPTKR